MAFNWVHPVNWFLARRHLACRYFLDSTNRKRSAWVARQRERTGSEDFRLEVPQLDSGFSFLVLGDTGEGDASQLVLVDKLLREGRDSAFAIIVGDVVYPAGRTHSYRQKFYIPYRAYDKPIYAVPGNHDWYDELVGFMAHFCDNPFHFRSSRRLVSEEKLRELRAIRGADGSFQPNMYFYIDAAHLRLVCLDTGIRGRVDDEQLAWLERVSRVPKPKLLLMSHPIFVDGRYQKQLERVERIVNQTGYLAVIGGDTHNFQKYRVPVEPGRVVWHFVNGGGGAFLSRTHGIPDAAAMDFSPHSIELEPEPEGFECYPTRDQSRRFYGTRWRSRMPDWFVDRDEPPYHQSFLKVTVGSEALVVKLFVVEGFEEKWVEAPPYRQWHIDYGELRSLKPERGAC